MATIKVTDFTRDPSVMRDILDIREHVAAGKTRYSNVQDRQGRQYVDLVMEGGGVLGLALVGFTYALEAAGLRFRSTAGTSAGAINALFVQAVDEPKKAKSNKLLSLIAKMPLDAFQDGDEDAKRAVNLWLNGGSGLLKVLNFFAIRDEIFNDLGLNPGEAFKTWVADAMVRNQVGTTATLKERMALMPEGLVIVDRDNPDDPSLRRPVTATQWSPGLKLVTTELATATRMVFPEDAGLCFRQPGEVNPAEFVRASMAVPVFFEPMIIENHPRGAASDARWQRHTNITTVETPKRLAFVDGGALSNFPISLFHVSNRVPNMPTVGAKLGVPSGNTENVDNMGEVLAQTIAAMRHDSDRDFIRANPDYLQLVEEIDTEGFHWLNFAMQDRDKVRLFHRGVQAGKRWLLRFDWRRYQDTRQNLLDASRNAGLMR